MNAVEIEQAITALAEHPFDPDEFPYAFLEGFGNKDTTLKRLRAGVSNKSDLGGVLQTNNIHIVVAQPGAVTERLAALKGSSATVKSRVKFILATDGTDFEAEDLNSGETIACAFTDFPDHFGFFLPLAGITTVRQISENAFDIRATSRLNRLYVELLRDNPDWGKAERRHDMNHFMARLIFCFFAEDTDIFIGKGRFTQTVAQMTAKDSSNTHDVISTLFLAMSTEPAQRAAASYPRWATDFPYVNGGLFSGNTDVPRFSRIARSYLLHVGGLDWTKINPDIFGSMIQAVAEDEERGELGMHYTSVPNILRVLNPLFLDELRAKLEEAGDNARTLFNLRKRIAKIRVFDPACGSGNFLVIAYKELRSMEAEINRRRAEPDRPSDIRLTNLRGIELRDFPAEIARLALIIAEYQCDVLYRGQKLALAEFLPLRDENWITCGNALRVDWMSVCPPTGTQVRLQADDLFRTPLDQAEIDFENEGGETYICGNPPYLGSTNQSPAQKAEVRDVVADRTSTPGVLDYVAGWFIRAADYIAGAGGVAAFVSTNSVCQGQIVPVLWPLIYGTGCDIVFAYTSFKWANLASHNAGVTVAIVGIGLPRSGARQLFEHQNDGSVVLREGEAITPYLTLGTRAIVEKRDEPLSELAPMEIGNKPSDGGHLLLDRGQLKLLGLTDAQRKQFIRRAYGSRELINSSTRFCLWIGDQDLPAAQAIPCIQARIDAVRAFRMLSNKEQTRNLAAKGQRFAEIRHVGGTEADVQMVIPRHSSENRPFLPVGIADDQSIVLDSAFALYDAPLWNMALIASRLHLTWIATICGQLETRYRYSNTLGWNTFPVPPLTEKAKADLTRCTEDILLAREHHFPATIADLYEPDGMPADLLAAHERNDEVVERIYIGRRFKNDTERLEKLFDLYTTMTAADPAAKGKRRAVGANT